MPLPSPPPSPPQKNTHLFFPFLSLPFPFPRLHDKLLLLDSLDAFPLLLEILLPERDFIIAGADGQHVAAEGPADAPEDGVEGQDGAVPVVGGFRSVVVVVVAGAGVGGAGPDADRLVLAGRGDVGFLEDRRRPGHVEDPVGVAGEGDGGGVGFGFRAVLFY